MELTHQKCHFDDRVDLCERALVYFVHDFAAGDAAVVVVGFFVSEFDAQFDGQFECVYDRHGFYVFWGAGAQASSGLLGWGFLVLFLLVVGFFMGWVYLKVAYGWRGGEASSVMIWLKKFCWEPRSVEV